MFDTFTAIKRVVVMLSKDEYESLLVNLNKIQLEVQYLKPSHSESEIRHAAEEMSKILEEE